MLRAFVIFINLALIRKFQNLQYNRIVHCCVLAAFKNKIIIMPVGCMWRGLPVCIVG
jgi:hypothetical protein